MGIENAKSCYRPKDEANTQFESINSDQMNSNTKSTIKKPIQNDLMPKDLKSFVNTKNSMHIENEDESPNSISNSHNDSKYSGNYCKKIIDFSSSCDEPNSNRSCSTSKNKKVQTPKVINEKYDSKKISMIQSFYKGYFYRKNKYPNIKNKLITNRENLLKELYNQYLTPNLKETEEESLNIKHDENTYKSLCLKSSLGIGNEKDGYRLFTHILILDYCGKSSFYVGEVNMENKLNGKGTLTQKDGSKYIGIFENHLFQGVGKYIDINGTLYEGNFINGKLEGKGILKKLNGLHYNGNFVHGLKDGKGKEENEELVYEGHFSNDKRNGRGTIYYKILKDTYTGEFKDDLITGNGEYKWDNKETYTGSFINGKMHGKGKYTWPDGGYYEGEYINNIKEGKGVFRWANGREYTGEFSNGKPNGKGILKVNNKKYNVTFKEGKIDGKISEIKEGSYKSSSNNLYNISSSYNNNLNINNYVEENEEEEEEEEYEESESKSSKGSISFTSSSNSSSKNKGTKNKNSNLINLKDKNNKVKQNRCSVDDDEEEEISSNEEDEDEYISESDKKNKNKNKGKTQNKNNYILNNKKFDSSEEKYSNSDIFDESEGNTHDKNFKNLKYQSQKNNNWKNNNKCYREAYGSGNSNKISSNNKYNSRGSQNKLNYVDGTKNKKKSKK